MTIKKFKPSYRVGFMGCAHAPYHNEEAVWMALDAILSKKPNEVIFSELFDFYQVGWWRKDPNRMSFTDEVKLDQKFVADLTKKVKKAKVDKITYIKGNHDVRLDSYLMDHAPALYGWEELTVPEKMKFAKHGWDWVDNAELLMVPGGVPYHVGKLYYLHGHEEKVSWRSVNPAKLYYEKARENVITLHLHRSHEWMIRTIAQKFHGAWTVGCCCELSSEFSLHNSWNHGFAIISYDADGYFSVQNKKIINGRVV